MQKDIVLITGNFNVLHPGHIRLFKFAKNFASKLVVGIISDKLAGNAVDVSETLRQEAVEAIEFIRLNRPDIVLWITTRKPEIASSISYHKTHFIHVSLDRTSLMKKGQIRSTFRHSNVFFSYQVHPDEELLSEVVEANSLIFMHDYAPIPNAYKQDYTSNFCPLNGAPSIKNMCSNCRRCFDGTLVA